MIAADVLLPACMALFGIGTGLLWKAPNVGRLDALLVRRVNQAHLPGWADRFLAVLRIAGITLFFIAVLVLAAVARPWWALGLTAAALAAEAITKLLKITIRRPRPFAADGGVILRLPRVPIDSSFPSADAMRAAFLSGLTAAGGMPWWAVLAAMAAAVGIGFGRVRSGAHYPLDVWAGLLIGLGAALAWAGTL